MWSFDDFHFCQKSDVITSSYHETEKARGDRANEILVPEDG